MQIESQLVENYNCIDTIRKFIKHSRVETSKLHVRVRMHAIRIYLDYTSRRYIEYIDKIIIYMQSI